MTAGDMFAHRLALECGEYDVDRMMERLSSAQWVKWQIYFKREPFGALRGDLRIAILCTLVANAVRGKGGRTYKPADFMPYAEQPKHQTSAAEIENMFRVLTLSHGGEIVERKQP